MCLSHLANKFYTKFNETPTTRAIKLLVSHSNKAKDKVTDNILDMLFQVDLDQYDEEWLTSTAESWIKWRTFDTSYLILLSILKLHK